ncbi:MAG: NAD-dependent deacylase [Bacteroidetes bacterium]|nr:NAD-dependent deacylase [Bacteroidota bacterium]
MKKRLVILSGAGVSAESGINTFRDAGGLWEGHDIMEVASPQGWNLNMELVLKFYNDRRRALKTVEPNEAHYILSALEEYFDTTVITQNVDDLHERAGSTNILHLHGELYKARSTADESLVFECKEDIHVGDTCELGSQIRPHIVWFGEAVPMIERAALVAMKADVFVVIGTSLVVYPAAGLVQYAPPETPIFVIDPQQPEMVMHNNVTFIKEKATSGAEILRTILLDKYA